MALTSALWDSLDKKNKGVVCWAQYDPDTHEYVITAARFGVQKIARVPATYEPRFGIDSADLHDIMEKAGELSDEFVGEP